MRTNKVLSKKKKFRRIGRCQYLSNGDGMDSYNFFKISRCNCCVVEEEKCILP